MLERDIIELLDSEAAAVNVPEFIPEDPVQFPRRFSDLRDIEITSLLVSSISWGNRKMILRSADHMLALMDNQPYNYVMDKGYLELPEHENIHRTFFTNNLRHFLTGLHEIYKRFDSLDHFSKTIGTSDDLFPAWHLAEALNKVFSDANNGICDSRCLPLNIRNTALKRLNMALRWLVRNDGVVDMGVWQSIKPSQLRIPLDVHVAKVSRDLGLINRKSNDRATVEELTAALRSLRPEDPVYYDFALFGIGIKSKNRVRI